MSQYKEIADAQSTDSRAIRGPPALLAGLRQLMILRTFAVAGQIAAIATSSALRIALPLAAMIAVIAALAALNAATWIRLQRAFRASHVEIGGHLAFDLAAFTLLLCLAGGSENPFTLLFVLHVVLIALLLPPPAAALGTLLVLACFSFVDRFHLPLQLATGEPPPPALMAFGDWLSFALTSVVVAWFVVRIAGTLREHERMLRDATQKALNDETILKLGALAAGAAHELTTPMTTMAVVADEIERQANTASLQRDVGILRSQIETCRQTISNLLAAAGHARAEGGGRDLLDTFIERIALRFRRMRPDVVLTWHASSEIRPPEIFGEQSLQQAILALLNNAADVSPHDVEMTASWDDADTLRLSIDDRGSGVPAGQQEKLGQVFFTTKPPGQGTGLGLVLASSAIKNLGGTLRWHGRPGGGTRAEIVLPLGMLKLRETA